MKFVSESLWEAEKLLKDFLETPSQVALCNLFVKEVTDLYQRGGNLFICGNGGSQCDSMHFAEELTGRFRKDRKPLGALALGDPSHVTCVANDMGFKHVFSRQLEALGRPGDLLVALTTSGNSENIALALETAKRSKIRTVLLNGRDGGKLKGTTDLEIIIPGKSSDRIQEMHMKIIHTLIESVERELFPQNY